MGPYAYLEKCNGLAMRLTFLRDVDAKDVQSAFREALEKNKVEVEEASVKKFLELVRAGGSAKEGKTIVVAAERKAGKEYLTYEDSAGKAETFEGAPGTIQRIFSLWLGEPADSGVENLQRGLFGK
jgi:hypothetical protein